MNQILLFFYSLFYFWIWISPSSPVIYSIKKLSYAAHMGALFYIICIAASYFLPLKIISCQIYWYDITEGIILLTLFKWFPSSITSRKKRLDWIYRKLFSFVRWMFHIECWSLQWFSRVQGHCLVKSNDPSCRNEMLNLYVKVHSHDIAV